jgi:predicted ATPase
LQPHNRFFALTGGPGAGKTTLVEALKARGHVTTEEAGRGVIRDEMRNGGSGLPWVDRAISPNSCSNGS